jgi:hypothetical protein
MIRFDFYSMHFDVDNFFFTVNSLLSPRFLSVGDVTNPNFVACFLAVPERWSGTDTRIERKTNSFRTFERQEYTTEMNVLLLLFISIQRILFLVVVVFFLLLYKLYFIISIIIIPNCKFQPWSMFARSRSDKNENMKSNDEHQATVYGMAKQNAIVLQTLDIPCAISVHFGFSSYRSPTSLLNCQQDIIDSQWLALVND